MNKNETTQPPIGAVGVCICLEKRSQLVGTAQPPAVPTIRGRKRQNFEGLRLRTMELFQLPGYPKGVSQKYPRASQGFLGFPRGVNEKSRSCIKKTGKPRKMILGDRKPGKCTYHSTHVGESVKSPQVMAPSMLISLTDGKPIVSPYQKKSRSPYHPRSC